MLREVALSAVLFVSATPSMAADLMVPDGLLANAVARSIEAKWLRHASSEEWAWYKSSESTEFHGHIADVSNASVQCFKQRAASRFSAADVQQFESVLVGYDNIFEIPDWDSRVDVATAVCHGADAFCRQQELSSQERLAAKSARLAFMELYAYLGNCVLSISEAALGADAQAPK